MSGSPLSFLPVLFCVFISCHLFGQMQAKDSLTSQTMKESYFITGLGGYYQSNADERMTNLIHQGPGIGIYGRSKEYKNKREQEFLFFAQGGLANQSNAGETANFYMARAHLSFRSIYQLSEQPWKIGFMLEHEFNLRHYPTIGNSRFNVDDFTSASFNIAWQRSFTVCKRDMILDLQANAPIVSYVLRTPSYAVGELASQFAFPWNYQRIRFQAELIIPFRWVPQNRWSLRYAWDYYAFQQTDAIHSLAITQQAVSFHYWMKTR